MNNAPGVAASSAASTFVSDTNELPSEQAGPFRFRSPGSDGNSVIAYEEKHEKELHLIVALVTSPCSTTSIRGAQLTAPGR
jgi:hypothetical protein